MGLRELFQKFGFIRSCKVATFEDGKCRGYGFVQFETVEASNAAIRELNGQTVGDKQMYVLDKLGIFLDLSHKRHFASIVGRINFYQVSHVY